MYQKRFALTKKQQAEYNIMREKFYISKKEYKEFYAEARKARKKTLDYYNRDRLLSTYRINTSGKFLDTRYEFEQRMEYLRDVNKRDWGKRMLQEQMEEVRLNLSAFAGSRYGWDEYFNSLSDTELRDFLNQNPDFRRVARYSSRDELQLDKYINLGVSEFETAVKNYEEWKRKQRRKVQRRRKRKR